MRWLDKSYPTYREPLTQYPTILHSTQFGYGRRTCQGQTVSDEDLFIGIGSIAWLFNISGLPENEIKPELTARPSIKTSISSEELNTGIEKSKSSKTMEDIILNKYEYPGQYPPDADAPTPDCKPIISRIDSGTSMLDPKLPKDDFQFKGSKHDPKTIDPTLDFTTLLIAKPLPFRFNLAVRDEKRAQMIRDLYQDQVKQGEFKPSREFWGENQGKDKPLGWGKV